MTRSTSATLVTLVALLAVLGGCATAAKLGEIPDITSGKADGSLEVEDRGALTIGAPVDGRLVGGRAHQWTFELTASAELTFTTTGEDVDTVLYVHDAEGELAMDDDGGAGYLSSLTLPLDAGTYRVTVALYGNEGEGDFGLASTCAGDGCGAANDPWALARDVDLHHVAFTDATPIPESYTRAVGTSPVGLSSPEWWQRWSGGATQSFSWGEGSPYGQRCAQASAIRLEAIMAHEVTDADGAVHYPGREAFQALIDGSGWSGSMFNWVEDVSQGGYTVFDPATMWAWRTGTVKWITIVREDGSCDLPTLDLVQRFADTCLAQAERDGGEIQGCRASN
ncbi:MAG: PPC domain-containing protein [Sandaracinaceae bacterium]|nr:PPC domain-containing protein [Sandaracinaceae bacterium]